jgi:hypothetical protein
MGLIRNFIKSRFGYLLMKGKMTPLLGVQQRQLFHYYQDKAKLGEVPGIDHTGFRVFSQFEEDGKLLYILAIIGMKTKRFIEIGSDDGLNSNCANLYFHFGYHGLYVDGNRSSIRRGERFYAKYPNRWYYKPSFLCAEVTRENINELISQAGFSGEVDLLSIDIDGNDYWIWDALSVSSPRVVMIETHVEFGLRNILVPYDPGYFFPGKHPVYHGASAIAMARLGKKKGYRLVGANLYGSNFIFVKEELCGTLLPEVSPESLLNHPSALASFDAFNQVKDLPYEQG